jgi:hypothetical protein
MTRSPQSRLTALLTAVWRSRLLLISLTAATAVLATVQPSVAAPARPVAAAATLRSFDAVATAEESSGWKHLALIGDEYTIFNDRGIFEGPALIRNKWPFLPARFTSNVDAAAVVLEGHKWKYLFVEGTEYVIFFDSGIVEGPRSYPAKWRFLGAGLSNGLDAISAHMPGRQWKHLATSGENYAYFTDSGPINGPGLLRTRWPWLPEQFLSNLDDVSVTQESYTVNGVVLTKDKISFYKGDERLIFSDASGIEELATLSVKWPFLNTWRARLAAT